MSDERYLTPFQADRWAAVETAVRTAEQAIDNAMLAALLELSDAAAELVMVRLKPASEALTGLAYLCHPQSEWMGGDEFKVRKPHIVNKG